MNEPEHIRVDVTDHILTITLDRPKAMNAFTAQMMREMVAAFDRADKDDDVRAVIVTGSGDRAFCAGADLSAGGATFDYAKGPRWSDAGSPVGPDGKVDWDHEGIRDGGGLLSLRIFQSTKPVIGAINGAAVGIGATMTLPMDFRLAAEGARFGFVFARRGIVPEAASSWFLPRIVGISTALDWCYSGRLVAAAERVAHGRGAEALGPGAAGQQVAHRLPHHAGLAVGRVAEVAVVRMARCEVDTQQLRERHVFQ